MKTKLLRLVIVLTITVTALFALGMTAAAETVGAFEVTGGTNGTDYTYEEGVLTVKTETPITIANTDPNTPTADRIEVADGVSANITLAGVNIDVSSQSDTAAFKIADDSRGNVTITLTDGTTNTLKSGTNCAGLQKNGEYIFETQGKLTIQGDTGILNATGGNYGAGIGGGDGGAGSNITISGGTVTTTGGKDGAGIGGGYDGAGSDITISGGTITATGGEWGAGIGGGEFGAGSNITISGGTVIATGGKWGAGIGGGRYGKGTDITISGGTVTATGGEDGAGIGGGDDGDGSNITISGGTVTATGDDYAAGIGGGIGCDGSNIQISNSIVTATGGKYSAGIGGGRDGNGAYDLSGTQNAIIIDNTAKTVTLYGAVALTEDLEVPVNFIMTIPEGATLTVSAGVTLTNNGIINNNGTTINNGTITNNNIFINDGKISGTIDGNEITEFDLSVTGGERDTDYTVKNCILTVLTDTPITVKNEDPNKATISRIVIENGVSANITLEGVNIDVSSLEKTAALMIADNSKGNVTITLADGTTNTLKSGLDCAGLQKNGNADDIGTLTIRGEGTLSATGGENGAGIGGGELGAGSDITISGGTVTATGGNFAAGIGGGRVGAGSDITISGGTVTATGVNGGAGIGGGRGHAGSDITISGGTITATGGDYGAGIGGGMDRTGSNITISGGSVKAVAGTDANAIGGGYRMAAVIPTDGTAEVYLLTIANPNGETVTIDGTEYTPTNHTAADPADTNLYVYLTGEAHTVEFGESTINYVFDGTNKSFVAVSSDLVITADNDADLIYGTDYTYPASTGVLTILSEKAVTISGTTTTDRIEVAFDISANITLAGVNIDVSSQSDTAAFKIADNSAGNVTITLADGRTNTLKSGKYCAGLQKNGAFISKTEGKLTIQGGELGTGILNATGSNCGAGIGGGNYGAGSDITISGGTVTAKGGDGGAGIGGGNYGAGSDITISGGTVTAKGGNGGGAGIGGGYYGEGTNITISGGTVTATGDNNAGAGIGGGYGGDGSDITISGGTVTATGGSGGAGIGGGYESEGSNITISGGTVTATGSNGGAGIGGAYEGSSSNIIISGGSVKAVAGTDANAIGGGAGKDAVTPTNGTENVYLLTIANPNGKTVTIDGTEYTPINHTAADLTDTNLYVYLPAKTAQSPNEVTIGYETTKYCYDTANSKWLIVVDAPEEVETPFTYNGEEQTYTLAESDYYTISDNTTQTNAGNYTVTVALKDKDNTVWSDDGTTDDKEYTFTIAKAELTVTAESYTVKLGNPLPTTLEYTVSGLKGADTEAVLDNANLSFGYENDATPSALGDYDIIASGDAETTNYAIRYINGKLTITEKAVQTITADDVVLTYGETDGKITAETDGDGAISYEVATGEDVISVDENGNITVLKAGTATVTVKAAETFDYAEATKTVTVTVNKAAVTVTAKSYAIKAGDTLPTYEYDVAGLVNNEQLPIDVTISCTADGKTAGTYDIVVSGAATSTNYTFSYVNGTLTVSEKEVVAAPTFTPASGTTFTSSQNVTITCATDGATIYYTTDGSAPTTASTKYTGTITITSTTTIKAIAVKDGMADSAVVTATYTYISATSPDSDGSSSGVSGGSGSVSGGYGGGGYRPTTPSNPEIGGKSASWTTIADDISKLPIGSKATIELNGNYDVPVDVIKAIADSDVKVTFIVDSTHSWIINGAEIETPAAADLSILAIASLKTDGLRGDVGTKFRVDGTNIPTELKLAFAKKNAGKFANLYIKDGDKLVFVDNVRVDVNGEVILPVSEQSDYVIMLCEFSDRKGDVSNDGVTNALDASAILKDIVELEDAANPEMLDYNGDGKVNALDASAILKDIVNGNIA